MRQIWMYYHFICFKAWRIQSHHFDDNMYQKPNFSGTQPHNICNEVHVTWTQIFCSVMDCHQCKRPYLMRMGIWGMLKQNPTCRKMPLKLIQLEECSLSWIIYVTNWKRCSSNLHGWMCSTWAFLGHLLVQCWTTYTAAVMCTVCWQSVICTSYWLVRNHLMLI